MPIGESHPLGRAAALKALELDESLGEAHRSLAAIIADHYWEWGEVERHYRQAIALGANDVTTLRFYSFYLAYTGRASEAVPLAEEASRLDPVSPSARMNLGVVLDMAGQVDAAVRQFEETRIWIRMLAWPTRAGWKTSAKDAERAVRSAQGARLSAPVPTSSRPG